MHFLKFALLASILAILACIYLFLSGSEVPPLAIFLVMPFVIFALVQARNFVCCMECGISPDEEGFDDPDRELLIKFDYSKVGGDIYSRRYMKRLKSGMGTCAACTKRIREQTKKSTTLTP